MPTGGGLGKAVRRGKEIGCTAVQVFTSSPQQWKSKDITPEMVNDLQTALSETGIGNKIVSHDSYLINLCAPDPARRQQSIEALTREINRCGELGIPYVVSHMGAHMDQGVAEGLKIMSESALEVLANSNPSVQLLMETTAGQGSSLNSKFEEIAEVLQRTKSPDRLRICLDTCHIFAAGYDLRTEETYEATFQEFDRLIGCERISVIHCNDSKKELGKRVDRHDHLGEGLIGETAFRCLVSDPRFVDTIIVVETPDAETDHERNVAKLWQWAESASV